MINVNILVPSLARKGPVIIADSIARGLDGSEEYNVTLYYIASVKSPIKTNYKVVKLSIFNFFYFLNADIIHSHGFIPDMITTFSKLFTRAKIISTIHNNVYDDPYLEYSKIKAMIISYSWPLMWINKDKLVCITDRAINYYKKIKIEKKVRIYNGIADVKLSTSNADSILDRIRKIKSSGCFVFGTCAVITKRKGISQLIDVLSQLGDEYHLVIIGDGPYLEELKLQACSYNIQDQVSFLGRLENPYEIINELCLYIMPSIEEGFGIAPIEAASLNIPILVSNIPTFNEMYGEFDITFELMNISSLKHRIIRVRENPSVYQTRAIFEKFNEKIMQEKYKCLYKGML